VKFGICGSLDELEMAQKLGFDYLECAVTQVAAMNDEEFEAIKGKVAQCGGKIDRMNVFFPGDFCLIGPNFDETKLRTYLGRAFLRARLLGTSLVVFGSGKVRRVPSGMTLGSAYRELVRVTRIIGEIAAQNDITVAIEPLNRAETNLINSLKEGAMFVADVNMPSVTLLADLFHILREREPMDDISLVGCLSHTHIARLENRAFPTVADNDVSTFFAALKALGYDRAMSIEGNSANREVDAAAALAVMKSLAS
jgi:sugar phosphate isomerase/epimerase